LELIFDPLELVDARDHRRKTLFASTRARLKFRFVALTLIPKTSFTATRRGAHISEKTRELIPSKKKAWSRRRLTRIDESVVKTELRRCFDDDAERVIGLNRRLSEKTD